MKKHKIILLSAIFSFASLFSNAQKPEKLFEYAKKKAPYDAIIVPGVPFKDDYWSHILEARIHWAVYLYRTGMTKNIIFSGGAVYTPYIESKVMALHAIELGVPENNIHVEMQAEHSVENVYYSYEIARELGYSKVALATDPYQSRMMQWAASGLDVEIDFIPFIFEIIESADIKDVTVDASLAKVENFTSLEERQNFLQRLRGTFGAYIPKK